MFYKTCLLIIVFKKFLLYNYYGDDMKHIRIRTWVKVLVFSIIIIGSIFLYARYLEPKLFIVKEYSIIDNKLPNSFYGFKIIQISDINYKFNTDKEDLKKIIKEINLLKPDIVILSGDLFNNKVSYTEEDYKDLKELLKSINYNIRKFAIKGDNDLNIDKWSEVISESNFIDLNDNYEFIYNSEIEPILIVGISSNSKNNHIKSTLESIYSEINEEYKFSILVLHEPDFINYIDYSKFNLIFAGHSLNGIIKLPYIGGIIKFKNSKTYYNSYYDLSGTKLYISSGIGSNKYKLRFLNLPSISLYRLRNK